MESAPDFFMTFEQFNLKFKALQEAMQKLSPRKKHEKDKFMKDFSLDN